MVLEVKECCAIVCVFEFTEVSEKDGSSFPKAHCTVCSCLLLTQTSGALCLTYHGNRMLLYTRSFENRLLSLHLYAILVGTILVVMRSY